MIWLVIAAIAVVAWLLIGVAWLRGWSCDSCGHRNYSRETSCWLCSKSRTFV